MRKKKVLFTVLSLVLSLAFIAGCAKPQKLSVGKTKFDAVLYVSDNYAVGVEKGNTYVYKDGNKLNSAAFVEVRPIEEYIEVPDVDDSGSTVVDAKYRNEAFVVRTETGAKAQLLDGNTGALSSYEYAISDIKAYTVSNIATLRSEVAGYIATLDDGMKVAISASEGHYMSNRYEDMTFEDGYFFGISVNEEDGTEFYTMLVEKSGKFENVFTVENEYGNFGTVTDYLGARSSLAWYKKDSADVEFAYAICNQNGEIDSVCANDIIALGGGYFAYRKGKSSDSDGFDAYLVDPSGNKTLYNEFRFPFGGTADGKVFVQEANASGDKFRIKELVSGKTTDYFDSVGASDDDTVMFDGKFVGYGTSDSKTTFFDEELNKITEFDGVLDDETLEVTIYPDRTDLLALGEKSDGEIRIYAYIDGALTSRALRDYSVEFYNGAVLMCGDDSNVLWIPNTNYEMELADDAYNPVMKVGGFGSSFYALVTGEDVSWIVHGENLKYLNGTRNQENDIAAKLGIKNDQSFNISALEAGSIGAVLLGGNTKYDANMSGMLKFAADNVVTVDYITYNEFTENAKTAICYGDAGKAYKYDFIGNKSVSGENSGIGGLFKTVSDDSADGYNDVYAVRKTDSGVSVTRILENVSGAKINADLGGVYITTEYFGKNALYDGDGNLLLQPRYTIVAKNGGSVVVKSGGKYGLVSLGKSADKSKLVMKIEYDKMELLSNSDVYAQKSGALPSLYNAKGKATVKNVVLDDDSDISGNYLVDCYDKYGEIRGTSVLKYTDGTCRLMNMSIKQSESDINLYMFAVVGMIAEIM